MRHVVLAVVAVLLALGAIALIRQGSREATLLVGGLLAILSLAFIVVARLQLGTAFSVTPQARALVTHGLYRRIPHPLYVFLDLALLGLVILFRQPWLLIGLAALAVVHAWASRRESRVLEQAYGEAYREYRRRTLW
jgi:protein-S-isoprenylcysteine O-methyltransferase Ste14